MILRGHFFRVIAVHIQYTSIINDSGVARRRKVGGGGVTNFFSRKVKSKKKKKKKVTAAFKHTIGYCE